VGEPAPIYQNMSRTDLYAVSGQGEPPEHTSHSVQAAAEGVVHDDGDYVAFLGEKFRLAERVSMMPMLAYANASNQGLDSDDMKGLAAMYSLIRSVVHRPPLIDEHGNRRTDPETGERLYDESEWQRFSRLAEDELADGEDLMGFVGDAMELLSARPRKRREVSSDGSPLTSEKSKPASSSRDIPGLDGLTPVSALGR
jgi:hypothetical protein